MEVSLENASPRNCKKNFIKGLQQLATHQGKSRKGIVDNPMCPMMYKFTYTRNSMSRCSCSVVKIRNQIHMESHL
jgi:hypothetical protein